MMARMMAAFLLYLLSTSSTAISQQVAFVAPPLPYSLATSQPRELTGRFLHITDIHPDEYYKFNSSIDQACHWNKPTKGNRAGYWGAPLTFVFPSALLLVLLCDLLPADRV